MDRVYTIGVCRKKKLEKIVLIHVFLTLNQNLADTWPSAWSVKIHGPAILFSMHLKYAFLSITEHFYHQKSFPLTLECGVQLPNCRDFNLFGKKRAHFRNSLKVWYLPLVKPQETRSGYNGSLHMNGKRYCLEFLQALKYNDSNRWKFQLHCISIFFRMIWKVNECFFWWNL